MERLLTPTAISPRRPTRLLAELGAPPLSHDVVTSLVGEGAAVLVRRALERAGLDPDTPDALERFLSHYDARLLDTTRPYPGMVETVRSPWRQASSRRPHEQAPAPDDADPERASGWMRCSAT